MKTLLGRLIPIIAATLIPQLGCAQRDVSVEWLFHADDNISLGFWVYPMITAAGISAGAVHENQVLLMCNIGGASEVLTPSRAYVLNLETGRVLKSIPGPTRTWWDDWTITPQRGYFRYGKGDWAAFDWAKGRIDWRPPESWKHDVLAAGRHVRDPEITLQGGRINDEGVAEYTLKLRNGRSLKIDGEARPGGWTTIYLISPASDSTTRTRQLCRLPNRPYGGVSFDHALADDDRRIMFAWGEWLVCVDTRRLAIPPTSTAPHAAHGGLVHAPDALASSSPVSVIK